MQVLGRLGICDDQHVSKHAKLSSPSMSHFAISRKDTPDLQKGRETLRYDRSTVRPAI
ncbi:MAG: hypothetical protein M2R45_01745 [Verrucomicrobia subdivision 3 bacterium]|nr:hypothetical protein [Limisphaerales bacterium]MCS1413482.1 hypothetical protein [Limisphaerales bacterium]